MEPNSRDSEKERLPMASWRGYSSLPDKFTITRSSNEIIIEHTRESGKGPQSITKRLTIKHQEIDEDPIEFKYSRARRSWKDNENNSQFKSRRSVGRTFDLLYQAADGWHLETPTILNEKEHPTTNGEILPTNHDGLFLKGEFLLCIEGSELKCIDEREYHATKELIESYEAVYILSYDEIDHHLPEMSHWGIENGVAWKLWQ